MALTKKRGRTKSSGTGSIYVAYRKSKQNELAGIPMMTKIGEQKSKVARVRGANQKKKMLDSNKVNLYNSKTKKYSTETIQTVVENPANAQYVRRNILTKGAIVQTTKGKARITSRPGQGGFLNAVLVE